MTTQALVDVDDFQAVTEPEPISSTVIGLVGGSLATAANRNLPTGTSLPAIGTPTAVRNLLEARETFGWLVNPTPDVADASAGTRNGKSYTGTFAGAAASPSGSGAKKLESNNLQRAFEGIYSRAQPIVVASRFDDSILNSTESSGSGTQRDVVVIAAIQALRDANLTGHHPTVILLPQELWLYDDASPASILKSPVWDTFEQVCKDLGAIGLAQMPPLPRSEAIGARGNTWAQNTQSSDSVIWRVYPHSIPNFQTGRFDITPYLASGMAERDGRDIGIAANPRSIRLSGMRIDPRISHAATSATVDSAVLRARNICPIVNTRNGVQPLGVRLAVPHGSRRADRWVNVYRVKQEIKRNATRIAEDASELNAAASREAVIEDGVAMMKRYTRRGWCTNPSVRLDPELDLGGNNPNVYWIITYDSVNPVEKISLRIGPSGA